MQGTGLALLTDAGATPDTPLSSLSQTYLQFQRDAAHGAALDALHQVLREQEKVSAHGREAHTDSARSAYDRGGSPW